MYICVRHPTLHTLKFSPGVLCCQFFLEDSVLSNLPVFFFFFFFCILIVHCNAIWIFVILLLKTLAIFALLMKCLNITCTLMCKLPPAPCLPNKKNIKATARNVYKNSTKFTTISPINSKLFRQVSKNDHIYQYFIDIDKPVFYTFILVWSPFHREMQIPLSLPSSCLGAYCACAYFNWSLWYGNLVLCGEYVTTYCWCPGVPTCFVVLW